MQVNDEAYADMLSVIHEMAARLPEGLVEYIQIDPHMPAGVIVAGRDADGKLVAWCAQEVIDAIPPAPFTGSSLAALAGIPIRPPKAWKN